MRYQHLSPDDALLAFEELRARWLVPIHWGCFDLAFEPMDLPPRLLRKRAERNRVGDRVRVLAVGERWEIPATWNVTEEIRSATERRCEPLGPEDCGRAVDARREPGQVAPRAHDAGSSRRSCSSAVCRDHAPFDPRSGSSSTRTTTRSATSIRGRERGLLSRPTLDEVLAYRAHVDERVQRLLRRRGRERAEELAAIVELGLHHEQQHQELILTDIKHLLRAEPAAPRLPRAP